MLKKISRSACGISETGKVFNKVLEILLKVCCVVLWKVVGHSKYFYVCCRYFDKFSFVCYFGKCWKV